MSYIYIHLSNTWGSSKLRLRRNKLASQIKVWSEVHSGLYVLLPQEREGRESGAHHTRDSICCSDDSLRAEKTTNRVDN